MKTRLHRTLIIASLVLLSAGAAIAQQPQHKSLSEMEDSFVRLMRFSAADASSETRNLHLRALGKAYDQYMAAVNNELKVLKDLLDAAGSGASEVSDEILKAIKRWEEKQARAKKDFQEIASSVNSASSLATASSAGSSANPSANSSSGSVDSAAVISSGGANTNNNSTNKSTGAIPADVARICGQVSLASLNKTLALINAAKSEPKKICRAVSLDISTKMGELCVKPAEENKKDEKVKALEKIEEILPELNDTYYSRPGEACEAEDSRRFSDQRRSVIRLLRATRTLLPDLKREGVTGANDPDISEAWFQKQIVTLEEYLGNVAVHVHNNQGKLIKTVFTDKDGNYTIDLKLPAADCDNISEEKSYRLTTEGDNHYTKREFVPVCDGNGTRINLVIEDRPVSLLTRAMVGYQQTGAAASGREQNFFFDFFASKSFPFIQKIDPHFGEKVKVWGAIRVSSVPQSGEVTIGGLTTGFANEVANLKVKDAARVFDFLTGVEVLLTGNNALLPSFDRQTRMKFALSFIAGAGVVTPEEPQDRLRSFIYPAGGKGLPQEIKALIEDEKNTDFLTFVPKDRDRFFRQYYAGFRIQSFFFNKYNVPIQRFPAQLDLTVGQNEYVSGGKLRGALFRIDGYFPLPYDGIRFINLFGTAILRPGAVRTSNPLVLEPADGVKLGSKVALIPFEQFNRDYYKAGVGIDFIDFVGKLKALSH